MGVSASVTGVKELDAKLKKLKASVQRKIMKAGLMAGTRVVVKAIKKQVPSTWKEGRKAIGGRVTTGKGKHQGAVFAKAGVGVGLRKSKAASKSRTGRPGVGIGASNLHWFIMGTAERFTGSKRVGAHRRGVVNRRKATGGKVMRRGKLKPNAIIQMAFSQSESAAETAIKNNIMAGINREWAKS